MTRSIFNLRSIFFWLLFATTAFSLSTIDEDPWKSPALFNSPCPGLSVPNGRVKIRSRGRTAKFVCRSGYQMLGRRYLTCVRSRWNFDPPLCITRGCRALIPVPNGRMVAEMRGALVRFKCDPGYGMIGSPVLVCDGMNWNGTAPICKSSSLSPSLSCDFEREDLCGWSQDPSDQFDWKRFSSATPSGHIGTGPPYDHTYGAVQDGFYLYIEASSPRKENDTARLFSPVFSPNQLGNDSCFLLWYHMYGTAMGTLKVYLKPQSRNFAELSPLLSVSGDQGNEWYLARLQIVDAKEPLQVVIEGIRGSGYASDIAIDDVSLQFGIDCLDVGMNSSIAPPMAPTDTSNSSDIEPDLEFIPVSTEWTGEDTTTEGFSPNTFTETTSYPQATSETPSDPPPIPTILESNFTVTTLNGLLTTAPFTTALPTTMPTSPQTTSTRLTTTTQKPTTNLFSTKIASKETSIVPMTISTVPTTTRSTPTTTRITPTTTSSAPTTRSTPTTTRIVPTTTSSVPTTTRSPSTTTKIAPKTTSSAPVTIRSITTTTRRATTTARTTQKALPTTRLTTFKTTSSVKTTTEKPIIRPLPPFKIPPSITRVPFFQVTTKKPFFRTTTDVPKITSMPPPKSNFSLPTSQPFFPGVVAKKSRLPFIKVIPKTTTVPTTSSTQSTTRWNWSVTTDTFNEIVTEFPRVDFENRPMLPPWFYLKRDEENGPEPDNGLYSSNHQAHTGKAPISVPTAIGIACVALTAFVIIIVVARSVYRRRKARQDGLTEDSDVRYLKDGEVRVEFFDRSFRENCSEL